MNHIACNIYGLMQIELPDGNVTYLWDIILGDSTFALLLVLPNHHTNLEYHE